MSGIFDQVINYAPPSLLKGTVTYKGAWSAATNTPTLINPPDSTTNGFYYVVSAAGTQFSLSFNIGDWIISNGSAWQKVDNTDSVDSVFGRTGAVVGVSTDYSAVGITATAVGASSPSTGAFTTLSATTPLAATSGGTGLSSLGTGVATFLGTPTSANLAAAVTNETGSGSLVFGTSPTITTPVIAQINDANGNETLKLASIASAVNEVTIENAATGNAVHISATGGDASVGLHLVGKGASGYVNVQDSTDATKRIMFNAAGGTTNTRTMLSSTQTVDRTLSLPDATDTLVGRATTDTLTNKTLTSPTITGGALNGTLGATTPSTVAATTISGTGATINTTTGQSLLTLSDGGVGSYSRLNMRGGGTNLAWSFGAQDITTNALTITPSTTNGGTTFTTPIATFTSTGLNSTAIGATTPSTGAFTTVSTTGTITQAGFPNILLYGTSSAASALISAAGSSGDRWQFGAGVINTGDWGVNNVTRAVNPIVITGGTTSPTTTFYNNAGAQVGQFSSTGLAVTGGITSTIASGSAPNTTVTNGGDFVSSWVGNSTTQMFSIRNSSTSAVYLNTQNSIPLRLGVSTGSTGGSVASQAEITTAGLAVTGTLSATGGISSSTGNLSLTAASRGVLCGYTGATGSAFTNTDDTSNSQFVVFTKSNGGTIGSVSRVTTTDAVVYNTTSDARLKENLRDFTDSGRLIDALKPRVFDWKDSDSNGKNVVGFVAQESNAADPIFAHIGAVSVGDDDPTTITKQWQRSDAALIPILVAELQSLRKRLAALESK